MHDPLVRILLVATGYWGISFALGLLSSPLWVFALSSAALLYLFASQMSWLDPEWERAPTLPNGVLAGQRESGGGRPNAARIPEPVPARVPATESKMACGVCVLDHEYRLLWSNDEAAAHLGIRDMKYATGASLGGLVPEPSFSVYLAAGDFSRPLRLETNRRGGAILSVWVAPYIDARWLLLSLDVTQASRLEIRQRDCVDNALHELRTPITVLAWSLDILRERMLNDADSRDYMTCMLEQCRRMRRITDDLRNLSVLELAPEPPAALRVDVGMLLRIVHAEAEALSDGRQRIVLDVEPGFDLLGARSEIVSAFSNLSGNAIRYTQPGGEIRLIWRASAAGAEFSVEDTGIGIAREHIPRLTERFFQVNRSLSRQHGGAGLGLSIVKDVLDRHQAVLEVESEPGKGSRFTARFPAHRVVMANNGSRSNAADIPGVASVRSLAGMLPTSESIPFGGECSANPTIAPTPSSLPGRVYG